ncbi:DsrE family protein [Thiomicrorhabdus sediminis]|uniref:DsrE family protein n=1 Tax=Thiomicrorhabdus sediminis TaxID=2580412 RepID=A0A4P9K6A6_9GAMM|nr:DsrE family protein [Thiomicrorhabdus sediminis]QCU90572.1 DsrE family protein [Thiomicrorhabdus sediminis]
MKAAILIHSDPSTGTEEALGRVFNALAVAHDLKQKNQEVRVLFIGTGTRWLAELSKADHPVHDLFEGVKDKIEGASSACSDAFGAADDVKASGFELLTGNQLPGTSGLPSIADLMADGYQVLVY